MKALLLALFQVLTAPDPAQMEKAADLGYRPEEAAQPLPAAVTMGAPSSVAITASGHLLVFNRGQHPFIELDASGRFIRAFGEGMYTRPHGLRIDAQGNIWTTDVAAHTVTKLGPKGEVLLVLGTRGQAGDWNESTGTRLLAEPTDIAVALDGNVFVTQGHGKAEPGVLKFDARGRLLAKWGGRGTGPGQFDIAHSIAIDASHRVLVADRQNRRVQIFDENGRFITEWKFAGLPCGLSIAPDGHLYLVSGFAGQILRLDANGRTLAATGQPGKGLGEFGEAHYLTIAPGGDIYVADPARPALHKFVKRKDTR
jgi:DNA-binding beta-propeller fold protein YncE